MPELDFVDGVAGYLRLRALRKAIPKMQNLRTVSWAEMALKRYEKAADLTRDRLVFHLRARTTDC